MAKNGFVQINAYSVAEGKLAQAIKYIDENKLIDANILLISVERLFKEIKQEVERL